jgi:DNA-binding transcriptional ArsR family regulator
MTTENEPDFDALERIFHEPSRLAIMSELCGAGKGQSFSDLKAACGLTDGNLNRHLKVLQDAGVVKVTKKFVGVKPLTTVSISSKGLKRFSEYLAALNSVLLHAQKSMAPESGSSSTAPAMGGIRGAVAS